MQLTIDMTINRIIIQLFIHLLIISLHCVLSSIHILAFIVHHKPEPLNDKERLRTKSCLETTFLISNICTKTLVRQNGLKTTPELSHNWLDTID